MSDTIAVHIVNACRDLMRNVSCSVLSNLEVSSIQVLEEVTARTELKNDVDILRVLEDINHSDDVRVLADLKDLNLSLLELKLLD